MVVPLKTLWLTLLIPAVGKKYRSWWKGISFPGGSLPLDIQLLGNGPKICNILSSFFQWFSLHFYWLNVWFVVIELLGLIVITVHSEQNPRSSWIYKERCRAPGGCTCFFFPSACNWCQVNNTNFNWICMEIQPYEYHLVMSAVWKAKELSWLSYLVSLLNLIKIHTEILTMMLLKVIHVVLCLRSLAPYKMSYTNWIHSVRYKPLITR